MAACSSDLALAGLRDWLKGVRDGTNDSGLTVDEHLDEMVQHIDALIGQEVE